MNQVVAKLLIGQWVRTKKPVTWADVRVPAGTEGVITRVNGTKSLGVDFGPRYGGFELYWREVVASRVKKYRESS